MPVSRASRRSVVHVRAAADDDQRGAVDALADGGQGPDEHVLALAGHQPGQAHDHRALAEPVPRPHLRPGGRIRREPVGVHPRRHVLQCGVRAERRGEPAPGVAADVGHHVGAVTDAAQRVAGNRQHRPADLVAVRAGDDAAGSSTAGARRQQRQRRRRAEPDRLDVVVGDQPPHPVVDAGARQHQRGRMAHDLDNRWPVRPRRTPRSPSTSAHTRSARSRRPIAAVGRRARAGTTEFRRGGAESRW